MTPSAAHGLHGRRGVRRLPWLENAISTSRVFGLFAVAGDRFRDLEWRPFAAPENSDRRQFAGEADASLDLHAMHRPRGVPSSDKFKASRWAVRRHRNAVRESVLPHLPFPLGADSGGGPHSRSSQPAKVSNGRIRTGRGITPAESNFARLQGLTAHRPPCRPSKGADSGLAHTGVTGRVNFFMFRRRASSP